MDRPEPKREVAIAFIVQAVRAIHFYATADAACDMASFGDVSQADIGKNKYVLFVDARFDFDEVRAYIEGYG